MSNMALPGLSLWSRLSLIRLRVTGTNRTVVGFYSHHVFCQSRLRLCRHYSSSNPRLGIRQYIGSSIQTINKKYEGFLKRRFPRLYTIHVTLMQGVKLMYEDVKDVRRIATKMKSEGLEIHNLPYRDMEKLRQCRKNIVKAIPLAVLAIPPFANYLVLLLMYLFPRQLLIPHFWTPRQKVEFLGLYHSQRVQHHLPLLKELEKLSLKVKQDHLRKRLQALCVQVQSRKTPTVSEVLGVRELYNRPPLNNWSGTCAKHVRALLFLTPYLPMFLMERRLYNHARELLLLDRALNTLGLHQLDESELQQACYLRGLDPFPLSSNQCREWLSMWLQVSSSLKYSEIMLLLHCMVFLAANYPSSSARH